MSLAPLLSVEVWISTGTTVLHPPVCIHIPAASVSLISQELWSSATEMHFADAWTSSTFWTKPPQLWYVFKNDRNPQVFHAILGRDRRSPTASTWMGADGLLGNKRWLLRLYWERMTFPPEDLTWGTTCFCHKLPLWLSSTQTIHNFHQFSNITDGCSPGALSWVIQICKIMLRQKGKKQKFSMFRTVNFNGGKVSARFSCRNRNLNALLTCSVLQSP